MIMRIVFITMVLLVGCNESFEIRKPMSTIEYRGQSFRLSKDFANYEEYSDSEDPIATSEHEKVVRAVRAATVPTKVESIEEMTRATSNVAFPGFQHGTMVVKDKSQFGKFYGDHVMIPYTDYSRYFIYRQRDGYLELIHEAELETFPSIYHFEVANDKITYFRSDGRTYDFALGQQQ